MLRGSYYVYIYSGGILLWGHFIIESLLLYYYCAVAKEVHFLCNYYALDTSTNGILCMVFRNSQAPSSALAVHGSLQPRAFKFVKTI